MARIRSIKPEFPQSESMGRVSRDACLLFIQLWTLCDDCGKARAASRMLASPLYPYNEDAPSLIEGWLQELEGAGCVECYAIAGAHYLRITKWSVHQKIDRATSSKFPDRPLVPLDGPREASRALDESSRGFAPAQGEDQGGERRRWTTRGQPT